MITEMQVTNIEQGGISFDCYSFKINRQLFTLTALKKVQHNKVVINYSCCTRIGSKYLHLSGHTSLMEFEDNKEQLFCDIAQSVIDKNCEHVLT